jgi:hypothetical protein
MHIYKAGRGKGKTETLVEWVKGGTNRAIVVLSHQEVRRLIHEYGLSPRQVYAYTSTMPLGRNIEVAIDNLDMILQYVYGNVKIATLNEDDNA